MRTQYAHTGRCGESVVKLNSAFECATFTAAEFTCAEHAVGFVRAVSRVHKPIGCFAVVGNKNQSFGVIIQSADRVQSVRQFAEKVGDFNPVFAVRIGTYDIFRLIKRNNNALIGRANGLVIKRYRIFRFNAAA